MALPFAKQTRHAPDIDPQAAALRLVRRRECFHPVKLRLAEGDAANTDAPLGTIVGLASTYEPPENYDTYGTVFGRGCFDESIADHYAGRRRVKVLWQHRDPMGRTTKIYSDDKGLHVEGVPSNTDENRQRMTYVRDEVVDALSIGFEPLEWKVILDVTDDWGWPVYQFTRVVLLEWSPVTFGANANALIEDVRALDRLNERIKRAPQTPAELREGARSILEKFSELAAGAKDTFFELPADHRAALDDALAAIQATIALGNKPQTAEEQGAEARVSALFERIERLNERLERAAS